MPAKRYLPKELLAEHSAFRERVSSSEFFNFGEVREVAQVVAEPFASVWLLTGNALACIKSNPGLANVEPWLGIPESAWCGT